MAQKPNPKQVAAIKAKQSDADSDPNNLDNQVKTQGKAGVIMKAVAKKANQPKKPKAPKKPAPPTDADGDMD